MPKFSVCEIGRNGFEKRSGRRGALAFLFALAAGPAFGQHSFQDTPINDLAYRLDRLETMMAQLAASYDPTAAQRLANLESAAAQRRVEAAGGEMSLRLGRIEAALTSLSLAMEQQSFQIRSLSSQAQTLRADFVNLETRVLGLERRLNASGGFGSPQTPQQPPQRPPASSGQSGLDAPLILDRAPESIPPRPGVASEPLVVDLGPQPPSPSPLALPGATPAAVYDQAMLRLQGGDHTGAMVLLEQLSEDAEYGGAALYWQGEIHLRTESYSAAAAAFLRSFETYPNGPKAADSLLGLGGTLARLERRDEACAAYAQVRARYGLSAPEAAQRAQIAAQSAACPG